MLAPGFLVLGAVRKSRPHLLLGIILSLDAGKLQLLTSLGLPYSWSPPFFCLPEPIFYGWAVQSVLTPLLGPRLVTQILSWARVSPGLMPLQGRLALVFVLALYQIGTRTVRRTTISIVLGAWLLVTTLNIYGALGNPFGLISALNGARYFLFGSMSLCLLLALCSKAQTRLGSSVAQCGHRTHMRDRLSGMGFKPCFYALSLGSSLGVRSSSLQFYCLPATDMAGEHFRRVKLARQCTSEDGKH